MDFYALPIDMKILLVTFIFSSIYIFFRSSHSFPYIRKFKNTNDKIAGKLQNIDTHVENISTESMRDATKEELQSTNDYVESISEETGVNFYSIIVNDFKYIPGENDAEYIRLLEKQHKIDQEVIAKAVKKIKDLSKQSKKP